MFNVGKLINIEVNFDKLEQYIDCYVIYLNVKSPRLSKSITHFNLSQLSKQQFSILVKR